VGDKAYTAQCARNVVDFLAQRGFGRCVPYDKFLHQPMQKEFFDIFKFLIAQLDPQLEVDGKIEVEVPLIMKRLRYPVEVNKSKLQAIGGPNTWPQLLAVLDWLISLIHANDYVIQPVSECQIGLSQDDADCAADHHMLRTLHDNYAEFLSGKDDNSVEERLRQIYEERGQAMQFEVEQLQEQIAGMDLQVHELKSEHDRLLEVQAAPKQLEMEADQLRGGIQAQEARAQRFEEEARAAEAEELSTQAELEGLELKSRELEELVESQAFSKKDIERLKYERSHLRRMLEDLKSDAEKAEHTAWELGIEESRLEECISRTVRDVNDKAEKLDGTVVLADGISVQELRIHVDLAEPTDALAALEFKEKCAEVETVSSVCAEATRREDAACHEVADEQRLVHEELQGKDKEIRRLKVRVEQVTRIREEYRVWSDNELDDARLAAEGAEDAVRAASIGTEGPSLRDAAEVDELRLRLSELRSRWEAERCVMDDKVRKEQEMRELHQEKVQKEMRLALETMDQLRESVEKSVAELGAGEQGEECWEECVEKSPSPVPKQPARGGS